MDDSNVLVGECVCGHHYDEHTEKGLGCRHATALVASDFCSCKGYKYAPSARPAEQGTEESKEAVILRLTQWRNYRIDKAGVGFPNRIYVAEYEAKAAIEAAYDAVRAAAVSAPEPDVTWKCTNTDCEQCYPSASSPSVAKGEPPTCNCGSHPLAPMYHTPTCPKATAEQRKPAAQAGTMTEDEAFKWLAKQGSLSVADIPKLLVRFAAEQRRGLEQRVMELTSTIMRDAQDYGERIATLEQERDEARTEVAQLRQERDALKQRLADDYSAEAVRIERESRETAERRLREREGQIAKAVEQLEKGTLMSMSRQIMGYVERALAALRKE